MNVYIAERKYDYEGFEIIGVFQSNEDAEKACKEDVDGQGNQRGDDYGIEKFELSV